MVRFREKNVYNFFVLVSFRGVSFLGCIIRKRISGNWFFIFISIIFMLWKRFIFIRR